MHKKFQIIAELTENIDLKKKANLSLKLSKIINGLQRVDGPINNKTDKHKRLVIKF